MKRKIVSFMCLAVLAVIGFTPIIATADRVVTTTETIYISEVKTDFIKTAENFMVLCDVSSSMGGAPYKKTGLKRIDIQRIILKIRNAEFPALSYNAGLYTFTGEFMKSTALKPFYEMKPYNKAEFDKAIDQLPMQASGITPLQWTLLELDDILSTLKGHTVVFLVTDGTYTKDKNIFKKPIEIAKDLARKYDVSFFVIDSSGESNNKKLEYAVSTINARSRVISYDQFIENPLFLSGALYVIDKRVVWRAVDITKQVIIPEPVANKTKQQIEPKVVDIETVTEMKLGNLLFGFDSADINLKNAGPLNKLGAFMQNNPKARVALSAFTDNQGSEEYNLALSRRRVESVAVYLVNNFGIALERIVWNFYGEANPIASNDTPEGRAQNRRIEGFIFGI